MENTFKRSYGFKNLGTAVLVLGVLLSGGVAFGRTPPQKKKQEESKSVKAPEGQVYFENLKDGDKVKSPFVVKMGLKGMKLRDAGQDPNDMTTGHHHIVINGGPIPVGQPIPADDKHLHYGKSQTEATVTLPPGDYTLTLQLADGAHRSYGEKLSSTVKVKVE